jgi:hypothetical protein
MFELLVKAKAAAADLNGANNFKDVTVGALHRQPADGSAALDQSSTEVDVDKTESALDPSALEPLRERLQAPQR